LMTTEFLVFNNKTTVKEASDFIYDHPKVDFAKGIFVVDENENFFRPQGKFSENWSKIPFKDDSFFWFSRYFQTSLLK